MVLVCIPHDRDALCVGSPVMRREIILTLWAVGIEFMVGGKVVVIYLAYF
jgi:hypothetical protein